MARKVEELLVEIKGDNGDFKRSLRGAEASSGKFAGAMRAGFGALASAAAVAGAAVLGLATAGLGFGLKIASDMEQATIAFTTLLGSGEAAKAFLEDLKDFAAKTPFEFAGVADNARKLLAMGFAADEVLPILGSVGDAVSAMGGGTDMINAVVRALGQMNAKGRVMSQEMNQLTETGLPVWDMLAEAAGASVAEMQDHVTAGMVSSGAFMEAWGIGVAARFGGAMDAQSQTLAGLFSTLKDEVSFALGDAVTPLIEPLKEAIPQVAALLSVLIDNVVPMMAEGFMLLLPLIQDLQPAFHEVTGVLLPLIAALIPIVQALLPVLLPLLQLLTPLVQLLTSAIKLLTPTIEGLAKILHILVDFISGNLTRDLKALTKVFDFLTTHLGGLSRRWFDAGANMVRGLIDGMKSLMNSVKDTAKDLGKSAWEGTKNFLGIRSPSRKFMELGEFSAQGFMQPFDGIGGRVVNALQPIQAGAAPAIGGGGGTGTTITFGRGAFEGLMQGAVISGPVDFQENVEAAVGRALRSVL